MLCAGEGEVCVLIRDCKSAWTLSREELVERICDYEDGRYPKIWCQVPCISPDYEKGNFLILLLYLNESTTLPKC